MRRRFWTKLAAWAIDNDLDLGEIEVVSRDDVLHDVNGWWGRCRVVHPGTRTGDAQIKVAELASMPFCSACVATMRKRLLAAKLFDLEELVTKDVATDALSAAKEAKLIEALTAGVRAGRPGATRSLDARAAQVLELVQERASKRSARPDPAQVIATLRRDLNLSPTCPAGADVLIAIVGGLGNGALTTAVTAAWVLEAKANGVVLQVPVWAVPWFGKTLANRGPCWQVAHSDERAPEAAALWDPRSDTFADLGTCVEVAGRL